MTQTSPPAARLRLLGDFDLVIDGESRSREFPYDKPRLLLAVLAMAQGRAMTRDELADLLWPDADGDRRARLRHALFVLRQVLRALPGVLIVEPSRLALDPAGLEVDAWDVLGFPPGRELSDAVRLEAYRGPLLENLNLPAGHAIAAWRQGWQARLDIELAQCRERMADAFIHGGQHRAALEHAKRWVEMWPDDEAGHRHLIRLLLRDGKRDAAIRAFEHCRQVLSERVGASPHPETLALIGLEAAPADTAAAAAAVSARSYRPLAALAAVLHWKPRPPSEDQSDVAAEALAQGRARLAGLAQELGGWRGAATDDHLVFYFGHPHLSERPVQAAAELAHAIAALAWPPELAVGVGLHAGVALVEGAERPDVASLLSHEALRLAWSAQEGEVLVSQAAADRLEGWRLGPPGRAQDDVVALLARAAARPARRMFGRTREFDSLIGLWAHLPVGREPTAVLLRGRPGMGKSLLARSMSEYVRQTGGEARVLVSGENPVDAGRAPLWQWTGAGGVPHAPFPVGRPSLQALEEWLRGAGVRPAPAKGPAAERQGWRERFAALLLQSPEPARPLLLVWENLHWADAECLECVEVLLRTRAAGQVMIVLTAREEFEAPWPVRELGLRPLDKVSVAQLVVQHTRGSRGGRRVRAAVLEQGAGVPLYIDGMLRHAGSTRGYDYAPVVHDLVAARLAQLDRDARRTMRLIAAAGDDADDELLPAALRGRVHELLRYGLLEQRAGLGWACVPVVRRGVLLTVPADERRAAHAAVADDLLARKAPARRVAGHLQQAGDPRAGAWWLRATSEALREGEPRAAELALGQALDGAEPGGRTEFECRIAQVAVLATLHGPGAPTAMRAVSRALEICPPDDPVAGFAAQWARWLLAHAAGSHAEALQVADRLGRLAEEVGDAELKAWAGFAYGSVLIWLGDPVKARRALRAAMPELPADESSVALLAPFGVAPRALALLRLAWAEALLGRADLAGKLCAEALSMVRRDASIAGRALGMLLFARTQRLRGYHVEAADAGRELAQAVPAGLGPWHALGMAYAASALDDGDAVLRGAVEAAAAGYPNVEPVMQALLAQHLIARGCGAQALAVVSQAVAGAERAGALGIIPELRCLEGDARWIEGRQADALASWRAAATHAQRLGLLRYAQWAEQRGRDPGLQAATAVDG